MFRYRTGTAGSAAGATAAANYFLSETLKPENELLAKYYAGETVPELTTGMDSLGRAIADGDIDLEAATEELVRAHERLFGSPYDLQGLEERISGTLLKAAIRSEMRDELAAQGGSVARVPEETRPPGNRRYAAFRKGLVAHCFAWITARIASGDVVPVPGSGRFGDQFRL